MFGQNPDGKPVDVIACESFKFDGEHVERGTVIKSMDALLAMELAGSGKVRAATKEALDEVKSAIKVQAAAQAQQAATPDPMAMMIAAAVTAALQAAGVVKAAPAAPAAPVAA